MKSSVTKMFRKRLDDLTISVQEQAAKAYALWKEDPYHPSLQFKRVSQRQGIYSARARVSPLHTNRIQVVWLIREFLAMDERGR